MADLNIFEDQNMPNTNAYVYDGGKIVPVTNTPFNEDVEQSGPTLWTADDQNRAASWNVPEDVGVNFEQLANAEMVGRYGPTPPQGRLPQTELQPGVPESVDNC